MLRFLSSLAVGFALGAVEGEAGFWPLAIVGFAGVALAIGISLIALHRTRQLARELHEALNDQSVGIQVVTNKAKALKSDED